MRRREFITLLSGAAAMWPLVAQAQQSGMPMIGYLGGGPPNKPYIAAFHQGLKEGGYVEGQNVAVEYRFANGQYERLPALATDLGSVDEIGRAFETFANEKVAALLVASGAFFGSNTQRIVALADQHALPAIYDRREFASVGGLISYGTRFVDVFRSGGVYVARILKGARPADLPVLDPTKFELVINLKTAKALGITVPQSLLVAADEVIE